MDKVIIDTIIKFQEEIAETNPEMEIFVKMLELMKKDIEKEANKFLDSLDEDGYRPYQPPKLKLSFNGIEAEAPIDFCEFYDVIQSFLDKMIENTEYYYNI